MLLLRIPETACVHFQMKKECTDIIILHFMIIKLCVIKTVRSINAKIIYIYTYVIHNKHPYILISKMMYFKHYSAIFYSMSQIKIH